jgi:hypothetical protein
MASLKQKRQRERLPVSKTRQLSLPLESDDDLFSGLRRFMAHHWAAPKLAPVRKPAS